MMGQEGQEDPNILDNSKEVTPGAAPDPAKTGENAQQVENAPNSAENEPKAAQEPAKNEPAEKTEAAPETKDQNAEEKSSDPGVKFSSVKNDEKTDGSKTEGTEKKHPWEILPTDDTESKDSKDLKDKKEKTHKNLFAKKQKLTKEEKLEKKKLAKEKRKANLAKFKTWTKKHKALTAVICVVIIAAVVGVGTGVKWIVSQRETALTSDEDDEEDEYDDTTIFPEDMTIGKAPSPDYAFDFGRDTLADVAAVGVPEGDVGDLSDSDIKKIEDNIANFIAKQKTNYLKNYYQLIAVGILDGYEDVEYAENLLNEAEKNKANFDEKQQYAYAVVGRNHYEETGDEKKEQEFAKIYEQISERLIDEENGKGEER